MVEYSSHENETFGSKIATTERFNCVFQLYPEKIQLSKKQRPKYWEKKHLAKMPQYIRRAIDAGTYIWAKHNGKERLYNNAEDAKGFVIKNSKVAGKPKFETINSQTIYQGDHWMRQIVVDELHAYFAPGIMRQLPTEIFTPSPDVFMHFEYIFFYPFEARKNEQYQDYINHAYIRSKTFEDTLVKLQVILDDSPRYVRGGYARYVNVPTEADRRLEIKIHFCKNNQRIS